MTMFICVTNTQANVRCNFCLLHRTLACADWRY